MSFTLETVSVFSSFFGSDILMMQCVHGKSDCWATVEVDETVSSITAEQFSNLPDFVVECFDKVGITQFRDFDTAKNVVLRQRLVSLLFHSHYHTDPQTSFFPHVSTYDAIFNEIGRFEPCREAITRLVDHRVVGSLRRRSSNVCV